MSKEFTVMLGDEPSVLGGTCVRLVFDTEKGLSRGWFECWTDYGRDQYVEGGLMFDEDEPKELADYDGVFELPSRVRYLLESVGIDTQPDFTVSVLRKMATHESAEQGEYEETEFTVEGERFDRDELAKLLREKGASQCSVELLNDYLIISSTYPDESRQFYEKGERVFWDVCINKANDLDFNLERDFVCLPQQAKKAVLADISHSSHANSIKLMPDGFNANDLDKILNIINTYGVEGDSQRVVDQVQIEVSHPITVEETRRYEP